MAAGDVQDFKYRVPRWEWLAFPVVVPWAAIMAVWSLYVALRLSTIPWPSDIPGPDLGISWVWVGAWSALGALQLYLGAQYLGALRAGRVRLSDTQIEVRDWRGATAELDWGEVYELRLVERPLGVLGIRWLKLGARGLEYRLGPHIEFMQRIRTEIAERAHLDREGKTWYGMRWWRD